jgi:phosphatidylethanolamine-binding protein (PEBP) family uncharacterized protein
MHLKTLALAAAMALFALSMPAMADDNHKRPRFTLSSPDLASGNFANLFVLNGFGCTGGNVSPELVWKNAPPGAQSFALQVYDPDAPTGSGFWYWAVYDIPAPPPLDWRKARATAQPPCRPARTVVTPTSWTPAPPA